MGATTETDTEKPAVTTSDTEIADEPGGDENGHDVAEPLDARDILAA
ncbi:hypothetical protein ABT237_12900 [Streptomyces sp. NPDC001581]